MTSPTRVPATFQPTLPHRERRYRFIRCYSRYNISTHAPAQGATAFLASLMLSFKAISTHAPAQGATQTRPGSHTGRSISTHAPAQGATSGGTGQMTSKGFQPTLPHRERPGSILYHEITVAISTHAPAQGATLGYITSRDLLNISTHAPAQGATLWGEILTSLSSTISTHAPAQGATVR